MAIFHASTKPIARSAGRSSVAAAAYRAGCELVDERTGLIHDYTKKGGVVSTEIITPDGLGVERNELWNAAEAAEKRKDARTAREWIVALPSELNREERKELAHTFGVKLSERFGVAVDIAIHQPDREGDNRNHHAHILTTTREVGRDETGKIVMGNKATIELSDKARRDRGMMNAADEVTEVRKIWERTANNALEQAGRSERIDHRTLKAQGIDREATTHLGPIATEMERRGIQTDRGDGNRQAHANTQERARLSVQIIDLQAERERREREAERAKLAEKRTFYVPFAEKNEAKELGAKWDREATTWYAPDGVDIERFRKWTHPCEKAPQTAEKPPVSLGNAFSSAIQENTPETPQNQPEAKKEPLPDQGQIQRFDALQKRLAAQRLEKARRIEAKAEARYERRDKALYAVNRQRISHESNPPGRLAAILKGKEYEAKLTALRKAESIQLKLRDLAYKSLALLRKYTEPDLYGWPSKCEKWAEAQARRLQPDGAALKDRQKELEQEAKKRQMQEQLQRKRERESARGRGGPSH